MTPPAAFDQAVSAAVVADSLDRLALTSPGVARYCSAGDWFLGAATALHPARTVVSAEHAGHAFVGALDSRDPRRPCLQSAEVDWGFASPVLGPTVPGAADLAAAVLVATKPRWAIAVLSGLAQETAEAISARLAGRLRTSLRPGIACSVASLDGGLDGFLSRRSAKMRTNLRRDARRLADAGYTVDVVDGHTPAERILERAASVASRSWKAGAVVDMITAAPYAEFYRTVLTRAASRGDARAAFITRDGRDEAFVFGAVLESTYRGFQLGFSEAVDPLGAGNQVQLALIEHLCAQGIAEYDLGMEMDYKRRWAERRIELHLLIAHA